MSRPSAWRNPLDVPWAVAAGGLLLVLLVRGRELSPLLALPLAIAAAVGLSQLGCGPAPARRRLDAELEVCLQRCRDLAGQAELVRSLALERLRDLDHLEGLGEVQLCCERLGALPERIAAGRAGLESAEELLQGTAQLKARLRREEQGLRREASEALRQERQRMVSQLRRNLEQMQLGVEERQGRLLTLSTQLELIDGGLRHLHSRVAMPWPGGGDGELLLAVQPLDEALDQIELLLGDALLPAG